MQPVAQKNRLEVKAGMTVQQLQEKGNVAQKQAAIIFDFNGDGKYDATEAYCFNNTRITADTKMGEFRLYKKDSPKNAKPTDTVKIDTAKANYAKRCANYQKESAKHQKFAQTLTRFGLDVEHAEWVGFNEAQVKTVNGKSYLVLKATPHKPNENQDFSIDLENTQDCCELSIPLDKDFEPSKIEMYRAEDNCNVHFNNLKGTLKITGNATRNHGFAFGGNSNVTVIGKNGIPDKIAVEDNAKVTVKTDDYADTLYDRTRTEKDGHYTVDKTHHLKPGTTTVKGAGKIK